MLSLTVEYRLSAEKSTYILYTRFVFSSEVRYFLSVVFSAVVAWNNLKRLDMLMDSVQNMLRHFSLGVLAALVSVLSMLVQCLYIVQELIRNV